MPYDDCELTEGVTYEVLPENEFTKQIPSFSQGFVRLQPYNQVFPKGFLPYQKKLKEFECRDDDVWVASFPKCGTTWTLEMVYAIVNNLDYAKSSAKIQEERIPFIELSAISDAEFWDDMIPDSMGEAAAMPTDCPRVLKTHLSYDMLPNQVMERRNKIVYVTRNPRDTLVSFFNHLRVLEGYSGSFEIFVDAFLNDECVYWTPFMHNVRGFWERRHEPNIMFLTYEEMKRDLPNVIRRVSSFLGKPVAESNVAALAEFLSFDKMKANPAMNKQNFVDDLNQQLQKKGKDKVDGTFMRKGQAGEWKNNFTPELERRFKEWETKWLKGSDLKFEYGL